MGDSMTDYVVFSLLKRKRMKLWRIRCSAGTDPPSNYRMEAWAVIPSHGMASMKRAIFAYLNKDYERGDIVLTPAERETVIRKINESHEYYRRHLR